MQRSASSREDIVTKPKPRDSLVHGSVTRWTSSTFPSLEKCFSSSLLVTRVDNPVTYRLLPGFSTLLSRLLDRLLDNDLDLDKDLETERPYRLYGDGE